MNKRYIVGTLSTSIVVLVGCVSESMPVNTGKKGPLPGFLVKPVIAEEIVFSFDHLSGIDLYTALENMYGQGSLQTPDLYDSNHTDVKHISWVNDAQGAGDNSAYLQFDLHVIDQDRYATSTPTRQRNEISIINDVGRCFYGQTMNHKWNMYLEPKTHLSSSFSHFAQLLNSNADHAVLTLTGRRKNGNDLLQVLYTNNSKQDEIIASVDWDNITSRWLSIHLAYTCAEAYEGRLFLTIDSGKENLVYINNETFDMWHGSDGMDDYLRLKFGYYRKIRDTSSSGLKSGITEDDESLRLVPIIHQKFM